MSMTRRPWILTASVLAGSVLVAGCLNKKQGRLPRRRQWPGSGFRASGRGSRRSWQCQCGRTAKGNRRQLASADRLPVAQARDRSEPPRPFAEVEKYIAFLDRADRAAWQKPGDVVTALGLKGTETVVDLGAGSGYFTFRFAKALPTGRSWPPTPRPR